MLKFPLYSVFVALLAASLLHGQNTVQRPRLLGLAHVAFRVSDVDKTRAFYKGFLGYEEPFSLKDDEGKTTIAFMKVNDLQFVELFQGDAGNRGQLDHFALYTDDLTAMRAYLVAGCPTLVVGGRVLGCPYFSPPRRRRIDRFP